MSKVPKFCFEDYPPAKPAKVANPHQENPVSLASLATLARGENENQLFHPPSEAPQASPPERILTCFECPMHEHYTVNPRQGWGRCTLKSQGCYGLRPACSEIPRQNTNDAWDG